MTKQSQKIILILLIVMSVIILVSIGAKTILDALDSVSSGNFEIRETSDPLKAELFNMISHHKNGELDVIDVSAATKFSWHRLYMFGDYTSPPEIDSVVGRSWRKNCYTQIGVSDGYTLLVFTDDNTVVHCLDYPKDEGNFLIPEQAYQEGLSPQESLFTMNEYGDLIWVGDK
ncbi:MAG: hypothetical protein ABIU06_02815 [Anaerolineales bacterium]